MASQLIAVCARTFVIVFSLACLELTTGECCEVSVTQPWEEYTYIPKHSTVILNCTVANDQTPVWTIKLSSNQTTAVSLQFISAPITMTLNKRGFYELPSKENGTILLLVNMTTGVNNGTEIQCVNPAASALISKSFLIVYEPETIETKAHDIAVQMANISWNPIPTWNNNYTLSVTSSSMPPTSYELQTTSFEFEAPPNAPPCEVYNFSVTASAPVGATYTGDGCSVLSPVLSKMLPSLPDIGGLESAISCSLERQNDGGDMAMTMAIMPINHYCADYPVLNYTLVMNNTLDPSDSQSHALSPEIPVTVDTLLENSVYVVKIVAANVVGEVSTQYRELYTTDVQSVEVVEMNDINAFSVHCVYLTGSNAKGCSVVIASESYLVNNITVNLTKDGNATQVVHSTLPTSCYNRVFGFDIEYDGSVAAVAVPGNLIPSSSSDATTQCEAGTEETTPPAAAALPRLLLVLIGLVILIVLLISIIITVLCLCAHKMKKRLKTGEARCTSLPTLTADSVHPQPFVYFREDSMPHYEIPANLSPTLENPEKLIEDDGDYSKTMHFHNRAAVELNKCELDSEDYAQLQENFYHVLEQGGTTNIAERPLSDLNDYDDPDVPPTSKQSSPTAEQFPVYQEITQVCKH